MKTRMFFPMIAVLALGAMLLNVACDGRAQPTSPGSVTPALTLPLTPVPPPSAAIIEPGSGFQDLHVKPLHFVYQGSSRAGLREVELLAQYSNEPQPFVISRTDARGKIERQVAFDWEAPFPGTVTLFARAVDQYGQVGESPRITGVIHAPAPMPPRPATPAP